MVLLQGVLTQLLLYVESLVESAGSVHAEPWRYRRHQWSQDLQRLSLQLPLWLPIPGQPQELPAAAARPAAGAAEAAPKAAAAVRRRLKKLVDAEESSRTPSAHGSLVNDANACSDRSGHSSPVAGESPREVATQLRTSGDAATAASAAGPGLNKSAEDAVDAAKPLCSLSKEGIEHAIAAAAAAPAAAEAAAAAARGDPQEAAMEARFAALIRCLCCGFGWNEQELLQLLSQLYEEAFCSGAASAAMNQAAAQSSSSFEEDRQWLDVRRRLDLLHLWGLYANVWKTTGLDCQRLADLNAPIDRLVAIFRRVCVCDF